jgi:hypothetical protein
MYGYAKNIEGFYVNLPFPLIFMPPKATTKLVSLPPTSSESSNPIPKSKFEPPHLRTLTAGTKARYYSIRDEACEWSFVKDIVTYYRRIEILFLRCL